MARTPTPRKPSIVITEDDSDRLYQLAMANEAHMPDVAAFLQDELARARVVAPRRVPPTTVTMNSLFHFRDDDTAKERRITLVYPSDADIDRNRVSVMSPIGAALIGLSEGQTMSWSVGPTRRKISITRMVYQPEAEGADPNVPPDL